MAMAHVALKNKHTNYERLDYMIRAKLYKGLNNKTQNISSVYDDEKYKLHNIKCCYCGKNEDLTLDHLIPQYCGGKDGGENLVYACKSCNSSKSNKDLLEWCMEKKIFPPVLVLRRYLKLANTYLEDNGYLELPYSELDNCCGLFRIDLLPYEFPAPKHLKL